MSCDDGWAALNLAMPPEIREAASIDFMKAWSYDFRWSTMVGGAYLGEYATDMGHAVYAGDGSDRRETGAPAFASPQEVFAFDPLERLPHYRHDDLVRRFNDDYHANVARYGRTHFFIGNADTRILLSGSKDEIRADDATIGAAPTADLENLVTHAEHLVARKQALLTPRWSHSIRYRADGVRPFLLCGVHLIPWHDPEVSVTFRVAHDAEHPLARLIIRDLVVRSAGGWAGGWAGTSLSHGSDDLAELEIWVLDHIADRITVDDLCARSGMSASARHATFSRPRHSPSPESPSGSGSRTRRTSRDCSRPAWESRRAGIGVNGCGCRQKTKGLFPAFLTLRTKIACDLMIGCSKFRGFSSSLTSRSSSGALASPARRHS